MPGVIAAIQTFGDRINLHPHLHFLVTEGGVDGAGLFHKAHRGKVKKASLVPVALGMIEEEPRPLPSKGWAALINWGHVPNSLEFGTCPLLRPDGLPSMRCQDEGYRLSDRLCGG
jgi:hypothetical protein